VPIFRFRGGDPRSTVKAIALNRVRAVITRGNPPFGIGRAALSAGVDVLFPTMRTTTAHPTLLPWIYDVQHLDEPAFFTARERWLRTLEFRVAARSAGIIVVSSETMANAFVSRFPEAAGKVRVLHFTTVPDDDWLGPDPAEVRERYGLPSPFLLLPGQLWTHKDHLTAFAALRHLRDMGHRAVLVCTGSTDDYRSPGHIERVRRYLDEHRLEDHVRILGVVPRSDYIQLVRAATLIVQPSLYEGWSSIVEDGRALGKRMVLSDIAVHVEQAPPGGLYFRTGDATACATRILEGLELPPAIDERRAMTDQAQRIDAYARTFAHIAREAAEAA
jgi:glycosyltransferase involved in cell wall biosynthesis